MVRDKLQSKQNNINLYTLDHLPLGKHGIIHRVGGERALRKRLLDMGLTPGTQIVVRKIAPLGDPLELSLRGYELSLRKEDARNITVELLEKGTSE